MEDNASWVAEKNQLTLQVCRLEGKLKECTKAIANLTALNEGLETSITVAFKTIKHLRDEKDKLEQALSEGGIKDARKIVRFLQNKDSDITYCQSLAKGMFWSERQRSYSGVEWVGCFLRDLFEMTREYEKLHGRVE